MLSTASATSAHPLRQTSFPPENNGFGATFSRSPSVDAMSLVSGNGIGPSSAKKKKPRKSKGKDDNASVAGGSRSKSAVSGRRGSRDMTVDEEDEGPEEGAPAAADNFQERQKRTFLDLTTLVFVSRLIAWEQFKRGVGRLTPVPLLWDTISKQLRLSEDASKTRVATLEALGRIQIMEGPKKISNGGLISGPNLFVLRWNDQPLTSRLAARVNRRQKNAARLRALDKSNESAWVRPRTHADEDPSIRMGASTHPCEKEPPRTHANQVRMGALDAPPSNKSTEQNVQKELTDPQSVSPSVPKKTDRQTERFPAALLEALTILDPPQVVKIQAKSPWTVAEVWQILESFRIFGTNLDWFKGTMYNALMQGSGGNGPIYLAKVQHLFAAAGVEELPEDGTPLEDPERAKGKKALDAAGLRRLPASEETIRARRLILSAIPPPKASSPSFHECSDAEANRIWRTIQTILKESLPESIFSEWLAPIRPACFKDATLTIMASSQSAKNWIEQQLTEDLYQASEDTIRILGIPPFRISLKAL